MKKCIECQHCKLMPPDEEGYDSYYGCADEDGGLIIKDVNKKVDCEAFKCKHSNTQYSAMGYDVCFVCGQILG